MATANHRNQQKTFGTLIITFGILAYLFIIDGGGEDDFYYYQQQKRRRPLSLSPLLNSEVEEAQFFRRLGLEDSDSLLDVDQRRVQRRRRVGKVNQQSQSPQEEGSGEEGEVTIYPWAKNLIRDPFVARTQEDDDDESRIHKTALFWHVPKNGGSTIKSFYRCTGQRIDVRSKPHKIVVYNKGKLVTNLLDNVDILFTSFPSFVLERLFTPDQKSSATLALFRHPVERLVSKFYYLQIASWEVSSYSPQWASLSIQEWVENYNEDNDHLVKKLAGKSYRDDATLQDLERAKKTLRERFVVGLTERMGESVRRFNIVLGLDKEETCKYCKSCMNTYFGAHPQKSNSNPHPELQEDDPAWQLIAQQNSLDMQLYDYILQLFDEQKDLIERTYYPTTADTSSSPADTGSIEDAGSVVSME